MLLDAWTFGPEELYELGKPKATLTLCCAAAIALENGGDGYGA